MIEVNLIPDVKREFLKAQKLRNQVISLSILVSIIAVGVVALLGVYMGTQAARGYLADQSIKKNYATLSGVENVNDIITIQSQLSQISDINDKKGINSRLFNLLSAINPAAPNDIHMTTVTLDPANKSIIIDGSAANSFEATDMLKKMILNTNLKYNDSDNKDVSTKLTDAVALSDTSYGEDSNGTKVLRFKMTFVYPEQLFSNTVKNLRIETPTGSVDVTDSKLHVPDSLFAERAKDTEEDK